MTFDQLLKSWGWKPIRDCPGRYVLHNVKADLSPSDLLGIEVCVSEHRTAAAKDIVLVIPLDAGGLISYKRPDGSFLHTLNTTEGFERKLRQLGIDLPSKDEKHSWF